MNTRRLGTGLVAVAVTALSWMTFPAAATAATFVVNPGQSIQAAINSASPGAVIVISPGVYQENLSISKDDIRLVSAGAILEPPTTSAGPIGICIAKPPSSCTEGPAPSAIIHKVRVTGITIRNFAAMGIFVIGGQGTTLTANHAIDNGSYGFFDNSSSKTVLTANTATGSGEAGFYIGDSPTAAARLTGNQAWNNHIGIFIRNAEGVQLSGNTSRANCAGVVILADNPGPAGHVDATGNTITDNTRFCPEGGDSPPLSGIGLISFGGNDVTVLGNIIEGNSPTGASIASGGVIVITGGPGASSPANTDVRSNIILHNAPADIVWDGTGTAISFKSNLCGVSQPPGLCP